MALGRREPFQSEMWVAAKDLPRSAGHVFYTKLNQLLAEADSSRLRSHVQPLHLADAGLDAPQTDAAHGAAVSPSDEQLALWRTVHAGELLELLVEALEAEVGADRLRVLLEQRTRGLVIPVRASIQDSYGLHATNIAPRGRSRPSPARSRGGIRLT